MGSQLDNENAGMKLTLCVALLGAALFCVGLFRSYQDDSYKIRCEQIQAKVYCQTVSDGRACFCQRDDGSLIPIPPKLDRAKD